MRARQKASDACRGWPQSSKMTLTLAMKVEGEEKADGACAWFSAISKSPGSFSTTPLRVKI
jgi:TolA-binding protein